MKAPRRRFDKKRRHQSVLGLTLIATAAMLVVLKSDFGGNISIRVLELLLKFVEALGK